MRLRGFLFAFLVVAAGCAMLRVKAARAQQPKAPSGPLAASTANYQPSATLAQVMRGILYPNSNVVFYSQSHDPADVKPDADPTMSPNPLSTVYGGWQSVENSSLALSEAANLLVIPGRMCSNGKPVPLQNADWPKFVQGLREAGLEAYKAAQTKDQDKMLDASDKVTSACLNCHNVYREKTPEQGGLAARCTK